MSENQDEFTGYTQPRFIVPGQSIPRKPSKTSIQQGDRRRRIEELEERKALENEFDLD